MLAAGPASAQPPEPIDLRPSVDAPTAEPFAIHHLRDLGHQGQFVDYVPEPDQGVRHVTEAGTVWWGWGPAGSEPRPLVVLFHGSNRTGESMVDLWREVAEPASASSWSRPTSRGSKAGTAAFPIRAA